MTNDDILSVIAVYDKCFAGDDASSRYVFKSRLNRVDGVDLIFFDTDAGLTSAVVYPDGEVFVLTDWQGDYPTDFDDIDKFDWVHAQSGKAAFNLNGLPRLFFY